MIGAIYRKVPNYFDAVRTATKWTRSSLRKYRRRVVYPINETPIIVLGNQKSGTSAIAALLGEMTQKTYGIDMFYRFGNVESKVLAGALAWEDFVDLAREYFSRDIIKDPGFTFLLEPLSRTFPDARYVFVVRDPFANIRGILNRVDVPGNLKDMSDKHWEKLRRESPGWEPVLSGQSGDCAGATYIETLALRCSKALELCHKKPLPWVTVRYEDFLTDKVGTIADIARKLSLTPDNDISGIQDRAFQPPSRIRSSPIEFFGAKNAEIIESICKDAMGPFSYRLAK